MRAIIHIDMDAFYASVEQRDNPKLRGKAIIVGGDSRRGVVATCSYEARRFGVRSAMSAVEAKRRCPHAIFVTPRMEQYRAVSDAVFSIFARYTPEIEGLSLDEAFLDVTRSQRRFGSAVKIAQEIRKAIFDELGLTASAGVAPNKFLAKLSSDLDKPDGLTVVPENVLAFLAPLSIRKIWGIGPKAEARLNAVGVRTIRDLQRLSEDVLIQNFGKHGRQLFNLSRGIDDRPVISERQAKSIGAEMTFAKDLHTYDALARELLRQIERISARANAADLWGHTVTVKVKYGDHKQCTRSARRSVAIRSTDDIFTLASELLYKVPHIERGVRLIGASLSDLVEHKKRGQLSLFSDLPLGSSNVSGSSTAEATENERRMRSDRSDKLEDARAFLDAKFGRGTVTRANLLHATPSAHGISDRRESETERSTPRDGSGLPSSKPSKK